MSVVKLRRLFVALSAAVALCVGAPVLAHAAGTATDQQATVQSSADVAPTPIAKETTKATVDKAPSVGAPAQTGKTTTTPTATPSAKATASASASASATTKAAAPATTAPTAAPSTAAKAAAIAAPSSPASARSVTIMARCGISSGIRVDGVPYAYYAWLVSGTIVGAPGDIVSYVETFSGVSPGASTYVLDESGTIPYALTIFGPNDSVVITVGDVTKSYTAPPEVVQQCEATPVTPAPTKIDKPGRPPVEDDPAKQGDAHYVPVDTAQITWTINADGSAVAHTTQNYEFKDGTTVTDPFPAPVDVYNPASDNGSGDGSTGQNGGDHHGSAIGVADITKAVPSKGLVVPAPKKVATTFVDATGRLAHTGGPTALIGVLGAALMMLGGAVLALRRWRLN